MSDILFAYDRVNATTWVYLSSLLTIGLFFKFSRVWSVRNLDLLGLILLAPGLLCVEWGRENQSGSIEQLGYIWLFSTGGFFLIRMLIDPLMVRRPLLEPNLSVGGLTFLGISLFLFLMANVVTSPPDRDDLVAASGTSQSASDDPDERMQLSKERFARQGPGYALLQVIPSFSTRIFVPEGEETLVPAKPNKKFRNSEDSKKSEASATAAEGSAEKPAERNKVNLRHSATARTMAILSHLAIVIGMVVIGYRHFDNIKTGIAAAVLYLLLPYTALMTGRVTHVLPAALLVWAIQCYRRPLISGMLMGLAIGSAFYPIFLLPLWIAFYWQRGLVRFLAGVLSMLSVLALALYINAEDYFEFVTQIRYMFGFINFTDNPIGFWDREFNDPVYRYPVLAAFFAMCGTLAIWPAQKNLGTLLSCSAAVMLGTQFWNAYGGGLYMAWYLPLLLLTIFRPNLEDRVALSVLGEWKPKRRLQIAAVERAA